MFLQSSITRQKISKGFNDNHGLPGITVHDKTIHSNIFQSIIYEIANTLLLKYWTEKGLTHQATWEYIDLKCFKRARDKPPTHMINFINKCLNYTLPVMKILHCCQHATSDLCPCYGTATEILIHLYKFPHTGSCNQCQTVVTKLINRMKKSKQNQISHRYLKQNSSNYPVRKTLSLPANTNIFIATSYTLDGNILY